MSNEDHDAILNRLAVGGLTSDAASELGRRLQDTFDEVPENVQPALDRLYSGALSAGSAREIQALLSEALSDEPSIPPSPTNPEVPSHPVDNPSIPESNAPFPTPSTFPPDEPPAPRGMDIPNAR